MVQNGWGHRESRRAGKATPADSSVSPFSRAHILPWTVFTQVAPNERWECLPVWIRLKRAVQAVTNGGSVSLKELRWGCQSIAQPGIVRPLRGLMFSGQREKERPAASLLLTLPRGLLDPWLRSPRKPHSLSPRVNDVIPSHLLSDCIQCLLCFCLVPGQSQDLQDTSRLCYYRHSLGGGMRQGRMSIGKQCAVPRAKLGVQALPIKETLHSGRGHRSAEVCGDLY